MADFLSRLIERSTGRASVAHPVVAPLFATGPELPTTATAEADPTPAIDPGRSAEASPESRAAAPPRTAPRRLDSTPFEAPPPRSDLFEPVRPPQAPESSEHFSAHATAPPTPSLPLPRLTVIARTTDREPDRRRAIPTRAAPTSRVRPGPRRATVRAATSEPTPGPEAIAAAPIVRISIGRIDVRATAPTRPMAPAPVPARRDEGLSLEEYLRRGRER